MKYFVGMSVGLGVGLSVNLSLGLGVVRGVQIPPCLNLTINTNTGTNSTKATKYTAITISKNNDVGSSALGLEMTPISLALETPMKISIKHD